MPGAGSPRLVYLLALAVALPAAAAPAEPPCTAIGMWGYRFGDAPGRDARRISESTLVATFRVPGDSAPFTERLVRIDKARGQIIEVEGLATMRADDARAWIDAFRRDNPPPPGAQVAERRNDPGFAVFLPGHAIAVKVYPGSPGTDQVQLSLSCQRHRPA